VTRALGFLVVLVAVFGLAVPAGASAHSELLRVASGPDEIRLTFTAPVEEALARIEVRNADSLIVSGEPRVDPKDPNTLIAVIEAGQKDLGLLSWVVLSRDGHVARGSMRIQASDPGPLPGIGSPVGDLAASIGRLLILSGLIVMAGLVVMRWWVVGAAWQAGGLVAPGRARGDNDFRTRSAVALRGVIGTWWRAWLVARAATGIGVGLLFAGTMAALGVGIGDQGTLLGSSRLGVFLLVVLAAVVMAGVAERALRRREDHESPLPPAVWGALLAGLPTLGLVAMSWSGHASTDSDAGISIAVDAIHNLATAAWIGGLVGLVVLLIPAGARLEASDRLRLVAPAVVRFSAVATTAVALLVVTGTYRALAEVGSLGDLTDTTYGRALLIKLGVFAVMLVVGGYNRIVLHTRLERAALGLDPGDRGAATALHRSVRAELCLAAAVLVAVAILLGSPPPR
jgi:copper transport protein